MEDPKQVTRLPLPRTVTVPTDPAALSITPSEMREIKKASGLRLEYLFGEEADLDEKTQMMVWLQLRRQGHDPSWDEAGEVAPVLAEEEVPDPTSGEPLRS